MKERVITSTLRRLFITAVAALVFGGVFAVGETPADAAENRSSWQYNICGGPCNQGDFLPVNALIDQVSRANPRPMTISVNEVCNSQYIGLRDGLAAYGYNRARTITDSSSTDCQGESQSNVVFSIGTLQSTYFYTYGAQASADTSRGENRKYVCVRMDVFAQLAACSTHLHNTSELETATRRVKHAQSDEAIFVTNSQFSTRWRFVGGDFNFPPDELYPTTSTRAMDVWYASYWEAAGRLFSTGTHETNSVSHLKIDYVWMDKSHGSANPEPSENRFLIFASEPVSDHALVVGRFLA